MDSLCCRDVRRPEEEVRRVSVDNRVENIQPRLGFSVYGYVLVWFRRDNLVRGGLSCTCTDEWWVANGWEFHVMFVGARTPPRCTCNVLTCTPLPRPLFQAHRLPHGQPVLHGREHQPRHPQHPRQQGPAEVGRAGAEDRVVLHMRVPREVPHPVLRRHRRG